MNLFEIENLRCSYERPYVEGRSRVVLEIKKLNIARGQKAFIVGESGIGKSTILETLGMMNNTLVSNNNTRFVFIDENNKEQNLKEMWYTSDDELSAFRRTNYSFIFQSTNLMRNFTAYENVAFTRMQQGHTREEAFERTRQVLMDLGLEHIDETRMAQELSGGQQQRLAFARAILPDFSVLFGDEPTGNLDPENAMRVMSILSQKLDEQNGASAIIVSHDMHLATSFADVIIKIKKMVRPRQNENDDELTYGLIDENCVFIPNENRTEWCCGTFHKATTEFEEFLRKK